MIETLAALGVALGHLMLPILLEEFLGCECPNALPELSVLLRVHVIDGIISLGLLWFRGSVDGGLILLTCLYAFQDVRERKMKLN